MKKNIVCALCACLVSVVMLPVRLSAEESSWKTQHDFASEQCHPYDLERFYRRNRCPKDMKELYKHDMELVDLYDRWQRDSTFADAYIRKAAPYYSAYAVMVESMRSLLEQRKWDKAIEWMNRYEDVLGNRAEFKELHRVLSAPVDTSLVAIPIASVNTPNGHEYTVVVSADEQHLFFTGVERPDSPNENENIFASDRNEQGEWGSAYLLSGINPKGLNEGAESVSVDGQTMVVFIDGKLAISHYTSDGWSSPEVLPSVINIADWQADAMLTTDGRALLFAASKRTSRELFDAPTVYDAANIYVSVQDGVGMWGEPIELGPTINTAMSDRAPYLHPDMKTLYFSSAGHASMGDLDVFVSTRLNEDSWTEWSEPQNLGKEFNTVNADCWYRVSTDGKKAYFSSMAAGSMDLYTIPLPEEDRPEAVAQVSGKLVGSDGKPVSASITWVDMEKNQELGSAHTNPETGEFFYVLPNGKLYNIYIEGDGILPKKDSLDLRDNHENVRLDRTVEVLNLQKDDEGGEVFTLHNVVFEFGKNELTKESREELRNILAATHRLHARITVIGHTDSVGNPDYNMRLSKKRAEVVRNLLIENGMDPKNVVAVGRGDTEPIATNETEEGRAQNRRVEFRIIPL